MKEINSEVSEKSTNEVPEQEKDELELNVTRVRSLRVGLRGGSGTSHTGSRTVTLPD